MQYIKHNTLLLSILLITTVSHAQNGKSTVDQKETIQPSVVQQIFKKAQENSNWKSAFLTGKHNQVVFMNVSPDTSPKNEIGMETHPFDQIILIVEGNGKADINGEISSVKSGDMIFIPEGTPHNVINQSKDEDLKIISIYSSTDIPAKSMFKKKEDESTS